MFSVSDFLKHGGAGGKWELVPDASTVTFESKAMWGLSTVKGRFTSFSGHAVVSDAGDVTGELDIVAESLDTGSRMRDRHLRSPDFFNVARYPQISVVVTGVTPVSENALDVQVSHTVTGTTRPSSL
ncbi:YceI family protein, partial [Micromonospora sp. WMMD736]|uniref:YceI family protein n=1 Tax=Micromonospora sp. WMMD736 TaxID=3404112 RepID=UPI003B93FC68